MALEPIVVEGPERETYYLGRITRKIMEWSGRAKKKRPGLLEGFGNFRRIVPVFVTYASKKNFLKRDQIMGNSWRFFRKGELVIPKYVLVESFSFDRPFQNTGGEAPCFHIDDRYAPVEKRTYPDGKVRRVQNIDYVRPNRAFSGVSDWDEDILKLLKPLPSHVLSIIDYVVE